MGADLDGRGGDEGSLPIKLLSFNQLGPNACLLLDKSAMRERERSRRATTAQVLCIYICFYIGLHV